MRARFPIYAAGSLLLALALGACQPGGDAREPTAAPDTDVAEPRLGEQINEGNSMSESEHLSLDEAVEAARQDLAGRTGKAAADIAVVRAQEVTWANGAKGCPQEGMMYTQALVPGYFILLRANGEDSAYHAGRDGQPFFCPAERSRGLEAGGQPQS